MKRFLLLLVVLTAIGAMTSSDALAGPIHRVFSLDSAKILGPTSGLNTVRSDQFVVPFDGPWTLAAIVTDSGGGNGATTDSIKITLQKGFDRGGVVALWPDSATQWIDVISLPAIEPTKRAGAIRYVVDSDSSSNSLARQMGGMMRFVVCSGTLGATNTSDTMGLLNNVDPYDIDVYLETRNDY